MEKLKYNENAVYDLTLLSDISEKGIVRNLKTRFEEDRICTYCDISIPIFMLFSKTSGN